MEGHPDQAELKPSVGAVAIDGVETNEDDLLDMISSLEERLGDVRELHRERVELEDELDDVRTDLEAREAEIEEREQMLQDSSSEISTERESVRAERESLRHELDELEARRKNLEAKETEVSERYSTVDQMRAQLEAAEAALRAERERREMEAQEFRREQEELAAREQELAAHAREHGETSPEIAELTSQLAEAQKLANERAAAAEERAKDAQNRTMELEQRCKDLAGECDVVRRELDGSRAEVRRAEQELPQKILQRQLQRQRTEKAQRSLLSVATWATFAVIMGAAAVSSSAGAFGDAVLLLGFAFAAYFLGSHAIVDRAFDPPALAIGGIGASFGWWYPLWNDAVAQALATWSLPTGGLSAAVVAQLPMAIAVATATLAITVGVFALTWSGSLLFQMGFVSLLAGALALFPDSSGFAIGAAAVIWHAITGSGLARWASGTAPRLATAGAPQDHSDPAHASRAF